MNYWIILGQKLKEETHDLEPYCTVTEQRVQTDYISHKVKLSLVFTPLMWLQLSSGTAVTERVRTRLGHGTKVAFLNDQRCPALDLTSSWPSNVSAFCPPHRIPTERTILIFGLKWPHCDLPHSVNQPLLWDQPSARSQMKPLTSWYMPDIYLCSSIAKWKKQKEWFCNTIWHFLALAHFFILLFASSRIFVLFSILDTTPL
jgi:hypothetical protein